MYNGVLAYKVLTMEITQQKLSEMFSYDRETGFLTWKTRPLHHFKDIRCQKIFNTKYAGIVAGTYTTTQSNKSYRIISIFNRRYLAHRIIWFLLNGSQPKYEIDHINGDSKDNRIDNLRDVSRKENNKNMRLGIRNTSGRVGVSFDKVGKVWKAEIGLNGKTLFIAQYESFDLASAARDGAEVALNYHKNHGG